MKLPELKIGDLIAKIPIIQGGMGVGVSLSNLAGSVAREGGVGVISTAQIGFNEPDFETDTLKANLRALEKHIKRAKEIAKGNGIVAINIMAVTNHYKENVKKAIESGIDLIISGAGLPKELPKLVEGTKVKIAPIISSARGAALMIKLWARQNRVPDMIVVEGPEAGGHLGFSKEELEDKNKKDIYTIVKEVVEKVKEFKVNIPVIAAGGIYTGKDIARAFKAGASGVQMATRFVTTNECDADIKYKQAYINASKEDIKIVQSPVGMPGRAIRNKLIIDLEKKEQSGIKEKCLGCIKTCNPTQTPYCITRALVNAVKGNIEEGLVFVGSNAYKLDKIITVKELMDNLEEEFIENYKWDQF